MRYFTIVSYFMKYFKRTTISHRYIFPQEHNISKLSIMVEKILVVFCIYSGCIGWSTSHPDRLEISSQISLQITVADIFCTEGGIQMWMQSTQVDDNDDDEEIGLVNDQGTRSIFVSLFFSMLILVDDDDE